MLKNLAFGFGGAVLCAAVLLPVGLGRIRSIYADAERAVGEVRSGIEEKVGDIEQYRTDLGTATEANGRIVEGVSSLQSRFGSLEEGWGNLSAGDQQLREEIGRFGEVSTELDLIAQEYRRRYEAGKE